MNILEKACDIQVIIRGFRYPMGLLDLYSPVDKQFIRRPLSGKWERVEFKARVPLIHRIRNKNNNKQNFSSVGTFSFRDDSFAR